MSEPREGVEGADAVVAVEADSTANPTSGLVTPAMRKPDMAELLEGLDGTDNRADASACTWPVPAFIKDGPATTEPGPGLGVGLGMSPITDGSAIRA
jgi:hypothetical protein